jgi:hypothetical protein
MLRGRIWGTPTSEPEQQEEDENEIGAPLELSYAFPSISSSSSPDLPLASDADTGPVRVNANGRVRGMVDKWERESASSRSSSRSSTHRHRHRRSDSNNSSTSSDADAFPTTTTDTISPLPFPSQVSAVVDASEEPSIEDLLAAESESKSAPMDGSWGARAWEDLDTGVTVRRAVDSDLAHDTVVPRRDDSGSGSGSSNGISAAGGGSSNGSQRARRTVVDIFADEPSDAPTAEAGVQVDEIEDGQAVDAELEKRERALEDEVRGTRTLLEEFRRRLEDVEARVGVMEAKWSAAAPKSRNDKAVEAFFDDPTPLPEVILPDASCDDDTDSERSVVRGGVGLGPESVSELPSYVFLVGLGVCTVVLQLVLKRVAGRSLKS